LSDVQPPGRPGQSAAAAGAKSTATGAAASRQLAVLGGLVAVLAALVIYVVLPAIVGGGGTPPAPGAALRNPPPGPASAATRGAATTGVIAVRLDRLTAARVEPLEGGRNPFRMGAAPPPPGQTAAGPAGPPTPVMPALPVGPPPPPPVPPIPLKFIGIVTGARRAGKIAMLSDGRNVFSGQEGGVVDGRYRIVRIGEESIQIEHLDGRGRQTIRLTGQ
jgi:hypothetical protein